MKLTDEEIDENLDLYGERLYYYNLENYPDILDELDKKDIIDACELLSIKIANVTQQEYDYWKKTRNNNQDDERKKRSLQEIFTQQFCDTMIIPIYHDAWWIKNLKDKEKSNN